MTNDYHSIARLFGQLRRVIILLPNISLDAFSSTIEEQLLNARPTRIRDNLTKRERRALKRLIRREDIIIKPADKGSGTTVMDMDCYENECLRQLNDTEFYEKIDKDITKDTFPDYNLTK